MTDPKNKVEKDGAGFQSGADCKPLLEVATRDLFRKNAFRVLGLAVDASVGEVSKHGVKIKQMEELGLGKTLQAGAFPPSPPPSGDEIRNALQRLHDPAKRMVDEFFWFWPEQFGQGQTDPAFQALQNRDTETAVKIWTLKESDPVNGVVARHNLAVLWHMTALECETAAAWAQPAENSRPKLEGYWKDARQRWELLMNEEVFWGKVQERIQQVNDPRLARGFAYRLRMVLPTAIGKIHGELALHYAETGEPGAAGAQARLMRETSRGLPDPDHLAELVLAIAAHRLKEQVAAARRTAAQPAEGAKAALALAAQATQAAGMFDLICGPGSRFRNELFDEVADACNKMVVVYTNTTNDEQNCVAALQAAGAFTTLESLKRNIDQNIVNLGKRMASRKAPAPAAPSRPPAVPTGAAPRGPETARVLAEYFGGQTMEAVINALKSIQNGREPAGEKLAKVKSLWLAKLGSSVAEFSPDNDAYWKLNEAAGNLLRGISLQAAQSRDLITAAQANQLALKFAKSPDLWHNLKQDQRRFQAPAGRSGGLKQLAQSNTGGAILIGGAIAVLIIFLHGPPPPPAPTAPIIPAFFLPAHADLARGLGNAPVPDTATNMVALAATYRIPDIYTNELAEDQRAIAEQRDQLAELDREESQLRSSLDLATVNSGPVADYRVAVGLKRLQIQRAAKKLNEMTDAYNSKLKLYSNTK